MGSASVCQNEFVILFVIMKVVKEPQFELKPFAISVRLGFYSYECLLRIYLDKIFELRSSCRFQNSVTLALPYVIL